MGMCLNCCKDLVKRTYGKGFKKRSRLKCMQCGYETSNYEMEKEKEEFLKRIKENNEKKFSPEDTDNQYYQ